MPAGHAYSLKSMKNVPIDKMAIILVSICVLKSIIFYLNVCIDGHFASHQTALQIALSIFCGVHTHSLFEWFNTIRKMAEDSTQRSSSDGNIPKTQSSVDKKR